MSLTRAWLAIFALGMCMSAGAASKGSNLDITRIPPETLARMYLLDGNWKDLDALIERLAASRERGEDGRFRLFLVTMAMEGWFEIQSEGRDTELQGKFAEYRKQMPGSAFAPMVAAMQLRATAWRARGHGFSSTVRPEGWKLFRERNVAAWEKFIEPSKSVSSRLPIWYEQAIKVGMDLDRPESDLTALFNEGINRFPGYHPLYFSYARQFSPRWGGDYDAADGFITSQVAAKTNPEGEILYARLYWLMDQFGGADQDFFAESRVSWPRMRAGFELLMQQFPNSAWNQANYVVFACRAEDAGTYTKWRRTVDPREFKRAAPEGLSLEVCDAQFTEEL